MNQDYRRQNRVDRSRSKSDREDDVRRQNLDRNQNINQRFDRQNFILHQNQFDNRLQQDNRFDNRLDNRLDNRFNNRLDNRFDNRFTNRLDNRLDNRFDNRAQILDRDDANRRNQNFDARIQQRGLAANFDNRFDNQYRTFADNLNRDENRGRDRINQFATSRFDR